MKHIVRVIAPLAVAFAVLVPGMPAAHAVTSYVALGDSYSSGTGASPYDVDTACQRSTKAYPYLVSVAKGYALDFVACSGATTVDVATNQLGALSSSTNVVTLTAGGNDVGFSSLIVQCTTFNCTTDVNNKINWVNENLPGILDDLYGQIRTAAPSATVIVLGYPRLFSGTCLSATGVSSSEVTAANNLADAIDTVTATEALNYGFHYQSAISQFTSHGVCASQAWIHGLNLTAVTSSYHPNGSGHLDGYRPLVLAAATVGAPGRPELDATSTTPNRGDFRLAWTPALAPGQVAPITYALQHQRTTGGTWSAVAAGLTGAAYTFAGATSEAEGSWRYRVLATGGAGTSEPSASSSVVVVDQSAPILQLSGNLTAEATGPSGAVVTFEATATDGVDGTAPVTCLPTSGSVFALGTAPVTCGATDAAGNTATGSFTVTVSDTTAPILQLNGDLTAEAAGPSGAVVTFEATATDGVDGTAPVTCVPASGSVFALGMTPVMCGATDGAGNVATGSFSVTVSDTTAPTLHLPSNMTTYMTSASGVPVSFSATATDLIDGTDPVTCAPPSGSTFARGTTVVACSTADAAGNAAAGSFTITVTQVPTTTTLGFTFTETRRTPTTPVTLRATVKSPTGTIAATGTVRFFVGGVLVGSAAVVPPARGVASKATLVMPTGLGGVVGRNSVSAEYLGDAVHSLSGIAKTVRLY